MVGHVARVGEMRNACSVLVGESEGKRPLGRPRREWIHRAQDGDQRRAVVNTVMNLQVS